MDRWFGGGDCDWRCVFTPRWERGNFASRYRLVYPALAYFARLGRRPDHAPPRCATTWTPSTEGSSANGAGRTGTPSWARQPAPFAERNLTYAGRLALFVGLYIAAYREPPTPGIEVDGESISYHELSARLHRQMRDAPTRGVSCYHHESMAMCNAALLINNLLHDRLFGSDFAAGNARWLDVVGNHLVGDPAAGPLFLDGTEPDSVRPNRRNRSLGADAWSLFLLTASAPTQAGGGSRRDATTSARRTAGPGSRSARNRPKRSWPRSTSPRPGRCAGRRTRRPGAPPPTRLAPVRAGDRRLPGRPLHHRPLRPRP